jgi:hypothetical protein
MTRAVSSVFTIALATLAAACGGAGALSPVAPSAAPATAMLTVRVVEYADQTSPIAHAIVAVDDFASFRIVEATDERGVLAVSVPIGVELTVRASANGYTSFAATGTLKNAETWTFYLTEGQGD